MLRMAAFTLADIDATIVRLKAEYDKLNHIESYGLEGSRQAQHRRLKEIEDAIDRWQRMRERLVRGGVRTRGAVVPHE